MVLVLWLRTWPCAGCSVAHALLVGGPWLPTTMPSGLRRSIHLSHLHWMTTKSRQHIYGSSIRASAERAAAARKEADRLACEAWNQRMLGYKGPAQPSPALGDALNAGYLYLEVRCLGCDT